MKRYGFVFGLGRACACTQTLRKAGLQHLSLPWDWIAGEGDAPDIHTRTDIICSGFKDWLRIEDLVYGGATAGPGKDQYRNRRYGIVHLHDFPKGVPLEQSFPAVREKYERRIARFLQLIKAAEGPILIVCMDSPVSASTPLADCREARRRLAGHFPSAAFEFLKITLDRGRPIADRIDETVEDGFYHIAFDYTDNRPGRKEYDVDQESVARLLKARFAVTDYRTKDEIRAMRERTRQIKMKEAGASNRLQYFFVRMKRNLGKFFK